VAGIPWADSYLGQLRALVGDRTLLFIGARGVIRDHDGRVLLIKRADNGFWAMPGGAMELGESITQCAIRETYEETGLAAAEATAFALYTGPDYTYTNVFGDRYQLFLVAFLLTDWAGELRPDPEEATDAGFFSPDRWPEPLSSSTFESMADLTAFERTGRLVLK
jgi:8-oxo-dGTP pyrophosphatase MutT (NUDIX family)